MSRKISLRKSVIGISLLSILLFTCLKTSLAYSNPQWIEAPPYANLSSTYTPQKIYKLTGPTTNVTWTRLVLYVATDSIVGEVDVDFESHLAGNFMITDTIYNPQGAAFIYMFIVPIWDGSRVTIEVTFADQSSNTIVDADFQENFNVSQITQPPITITIQHNNTEVVTVNNTVNNTVYLPADPLAALRDFFFTTIPNFLATYAPQVLTAIGGVFVTAITAYLHKHLKLGDNNGQA